MFLVTINIILGILNLALFVVGHRPISITTAVFNFAVAGIVYALEQ